MQRTLLRLMRLPIFVLMWLIGVMGVLFTVGSTTVGAWIEVVLRRLGYRGKPMIVPIILGTIGFVLSIILIPAYLGATFVGWPAALAAPLLMLALLAVVGKW